MHGVHNKGEVSRRKEIAKKDRIWDTHQPGTGPSSRKMNIPPSEFSPYTSLRRKGGLLGGGGGRASETMNCCLGKTNRLLLTKQKVPVGKLICRSTCA